MGKFDFTQAEYEELLSKIILNQQEKQILDMKLLDEYEVKIADTLHISVKTVQRRWKKIKDKIKKVI